MTATSSLISSSMNPFFDLSRSPDSSSARYFCFCLSKVIEEKNRRAFLNFSKENVKFPIQTQSSRTKKHAPTTSNVRGTHCVSNGVLLFFFNPVIEGFFYK